MLTRAAIPTRDDIQEFNKYFRNHHFVSHGDYVRGDINYSFYDDSPRITESRIIKKYIPSSRGNGIYQKKLALKPDTPAETFSLGDYNVLGANNCFSAACNKTIL